VLAEISSPLAEQPAAKKQMATTIITTLQWKPLDLVMRGSLSPGFTVWDSPKYEIGHPREQKD
jgi:hypothetical protein